MGVEPAVVTSAQQPLDANMPDLRDDIQYFRVKPPPVLRRSPIREWQLMHALHKQLISACETFRPQLIHAHSPVLVGLPALRIARQFSIPFVYEIRDLWENASVDRGKFSQRSFFYRGARALETYVLRRADALFTIGDNLKQELASRSGVDITVAFNGVDVDSFRPQVAAAEWQQRWNPSRSPLIAYVGSFQPYEGLDVLLVAFGLIKQSKPAVRLLIAGDGPERVAMQTTAQRLGIAESVSFVGRVPHNQVGEIYAVADLLVYPRLDTLTTRMTTPLKPLEALSAGRAVIASDLPALRELIQDKLTGWLFTAGSAEDLARKAVELLGLPEIRRALGQAGRESLQTRTWRASVECYLPVYERLIAKH